MAIKKPTTTEDLTSSAQAAGPTESERLAEIVELTDPGVVANVKAPAYVKVKSPAGVVTEVPEGIVDALVESGYTKIK